MKESAVASLQAGSRPTLPLEVLNDLVATGLTSSGLGKLLARWALEYTSVSWCVVCFSTATGQEVNLEGRRVNGNVHVRLTNRPQHGDGREVPIVHSDHVVGCILIPAGAADADELTTLQQFARQFGFLLHYQSQRDLADRLAIRDPLTGLFNRRHLHEQLERWIPSARKDRLPLSLFLLDVDHFKQINDTYGHNACDRALQLLGGLMRSLFRSDDLVCRYGGEEFAILLCDYRDGVVADHPSEVWRYAERLRLAAEALPLPAEDGRLLSRITISGGIATFPWDANSADELLRSADQALYQAKRNGRNRICLANRAEARAG